MKTALLILFIFFQTAFAELATLKRVIDADTLVFESELNGEYKCRLYGVDAPEKSKSKKLEKDARLAKAEKKDIIEAGKKASLFAKKSLKLNAPYVLGIYDTDRYGRKLCVVYYEQGNFNEKLLSSGFGVVYKKGKYTESAELKETLKKAQLQAISSNAGLWRSAKNIMWSMANN